MKQSQLFYKSRQENSSDELSTSAQLLYRADYIDKLSAGVYSLLPLGLLAHRNIERIIRDEMNSIGAQELLMPSLISKSYWEETGRWKTYIPPLFKVRDRHGKEFGLGSTHEEVITKIVRSRIESYKELPMALYQIQNKFRNEMRSQAGLLRTREFFMKDLYSFHATQAELAEYYDTVVATYKRIYARCGLSIVAVEASAGSIGGSRSHEFQVESEQGEDTFISCDACGWHVNVEKLEEQGLSRKGDCSRCNGKLIAKKGIECGHTFYLGDKYSDVMGARYMDKDGESKVLQMGCYGIGIGRLLATIIEIHHDADGIHWPEEVAPYNVHILQLGESQEVRKIAHKLYKGLSLAHTSVLWDDREVSPGQKLRESDLLGMPHRFVVSEKSLRNKGVEYKKRTESSVRSMSLSSAISFNV